MPRGPQEARLDRAVSGAARSAIQAAEQEWRDGARSLDSVATALELAGPQVIANFGGTHTGPAAQEAFGKVAEKVRARKAQMEQAADALARADAAVGEAQQVRASLGALPSQPARPDIAPGTNDADAVRQQRAYSTQLGSYHAAMADREAKAEAAANEMDRVYRDSTATMQQVHGEPDARSGGSGSGGGGGGGGGGGAVRTTGGSSAGGAHAPSASGTTSSPHHAPATAGATSGTASGGTPHVVAPAGATPPVITAPGTAQDGTTLPPMSTPAATVGATGSAPAVGSTGTNVAGGLAGALGGGLVGGAAGIGGAVRSGGSAVPVASSGRSIGSSTARSAASGTLGRSATTAASTTSASRAGSVGAATRSTGAATGRTGGRGAPGSAGAAGSRGQQPAKTGVRPGPRGTGMATRGGRGHDEDPDDRDDLFESPQDWVDDEDAAPGVIE